MMGTGVPSARCRSDGVRRVEPAIQFREVHEADRPVVVRGLHGVPPYHVVAVRDAFRLLRPRREKHAAFSMPPSASTYLLACT